ncbi:hypothetical protein FHS15_005163 [Paenibacillus castaneae]|nr:hypothetical protein [Paenibacillus castaneae]
MEILIIIIIVFGLAGIIGNQYAMIRKMEEMNKTLHEILNKK